MKAAYPAFAVLLLSVTACSTLSYPRPVEGDFAHIVLFWMEGQSETGKMEFREAMETFIRSSAYAKQMHIGTPAGTEREVVDNSYDSLQRF